MNKEGYLSQYFEKVAAKRLSPVEADTSASHQHEFNGSRALKSVLGTGTGEKVQFPASFLWLGEEDAALSSEGFVTWYDSRLGHPTRSEYRLYFPTTEVSEMARAGDLLLIGRRPDDSIMIIICASGSSIESQLLWLFKIPAQTGLDFTLKDIANDDNTKVDFAASFILDQVGIETEVPETNYFDAVLAKFKGRFPSTREFSEETRRLLKNVNPLDDPDQSLMAWMDHEVKLFRWIERHEVEKRLKEGFVQGDVTDVDGFLKFSLSIQNRRKARAGLALENHLEEIFRLHGIRYERTAETENRVKPDFLFPGRPQYLNMNFPEANLIMLGVKTTCKDRWRQVLSEAARVRNKHLFTLEPGISSHQTDEMQANHLQLVLPSPLHDTYDKKQQGWLMNTKDFIKYVQGRQKSVR